MIRYSLACDKGHDFESWFPSSAAYDKQTKRGLVSCPVCGSGKVDKTIMAPQLKRTDKSASGSPDGVEDTSAIPSPSPEPASTPVALMSPQEREFRAKLKELREHVTRNADYVGQRFPDEARKIHYGDTEKRSIYGEASAQDAKALLEEGIEFHPLPMLPEDRN
ncbi:MAG: hypothetical protein QOD74_686 [Variibacter sp.]|nr:hypothetical protein [Variibacter sp.]